jgi:hypothetical protein
MILIKSSTAVLRSHTGTQKRVTKEKRLEFVFGGECSDYGTETGQCGNCATARNSVSTGLSGLVRKVAASFLSI